MNRNMNQKKMNENKVMIWKVDVDDEHLTFTEVQRPDDFVSKSEFVKDCEHTGTYCGNRAYGDTNFKLVRRLKAELFYDSNFKDEHGNFSLREWRMAFGYAYAWTPASFYNYNGQLYTTHINFR